MSPNVALRIVLMEACRTRPIAHVAQHADSNVDSVLGVLEVGSVLLGFGVQHYAQATRSLVSRLRQPLRSLRLELSCSAAGAEYPSSTGRGYSLLNGTT